MKVAILCVFFAVFLGGNCFLNDFSNDNRFSQVDLLLKSTSLKDLKEALHILEALEIEEKDDWEYLIKMAETNWKIALNGRDDISYDYKKDHYTKAHDYAEESMNKHRNSPNVQKWYAITLGSLGEYVSLKQKVKNGYTFKTHIQEALKMTDTDGHLYHLYGRFCFEVSDLSWLERSIASALFGSIPKSTKEEALSYFKNAESLDDEWGENNMYLAKCYIDSKDYATAAKYLEKATISTPRSTDSDDIYDEIKKLMKKYKKYL